MKFIHRVLVVMTFLAVLGAAFRGDAQPPGKTARVGWLAVGESNTTVFLEAFREGMRERGWVEGKNLVLDARWGTRATSASWPTS
jgi:hypothetical protein